MEIRNTTLDDVASVIGFSATLRLAAWYGDLSNLYVPKAVDESQVLVRLLGAPAARRLCEAFPGEWINVPKLPVYQSDRKRRMIQRMAMAGFSKREIAGYLEMSARRVEQILVELQTSGLSDVPVHHNSLVCRSESALEKTDGKIAREKQVRKSVAKVPRKKHPEKLG